MAKAVQQKLPHTREAKSSIHKARCLSCPNMVLKAWRIPRKLLVFSPHRKPKEADSNISERMISGSKRVDELTI